MATTMFRRLMGVAAAAAMFMVATATGPAAALERSAVKLDGSTQKLDRLTLKDGTVLEGRVTREIDGAIWFAYSIAGVEQTKMFTPTEYSSL